MAEGLNNLDNLDWAEEAAPPPPALSTAHLMPIDMPAHVSVKVGVDADSIQVGKDGVVRYVMVMTNGSGSSTALYEGIRCASAEVKTYARLGSSGQWTPLVNPAWKAMTDNMPSRHALAFARQAACENTLAASKQDILSALKTPRKGSSAARNP